MSGGIYSRDLVCDFGAVYASFGPETVAFLEAARNWVDPCGGVTAKGSCDGDNATRCTTLAEGKRRLTVTDCSLFGQTCAVASDGTATCADPGETPTVLEEPDYCDDYPFPGGPIVPGRPVPSEDDEPSGDLPFSPQWPR